MARIMMAMSSLFMVWAQDFALFAFAQIMFGFGQGFSRPGFSAGASLAATHEQQGDVAGLITAANGMGFVSRRFSACGCTRTSPAPRPSSSARSWLLLLAIYAFFTTPRDTGLRLDAVKDAVAKDKPPE
jgi:hypothetical protein